VSEARPDIIRFGPDLAISWEAYKQGINEADVPEGTYLIRNQAGNLALIDTEGNYRGFIDTTAGHVDVIANRDSGDTHTPP